MNNRRTNPLQLSEMVSLKLGNVQPTHQMVIKYLRGAMRAMPRHLSNTVQESFIQIHPYLRCSKAGAIPTSLCCSDTGSSSIELAHSKLLNQLKIL
ncbi:hypothetical protein GQ600_2739 [Phytophthora cactorum]|nr:hypothetical protein GQ600_2738 [Phytophthora cactorum]KAF1781290.1 hypothetical protein GQ600_2739 [Phytophthora cactorum]